MVRRIFNTLPFVALVGVPLFVLALLHSVGTPFVLWWGTSFEMGTVGAYLLFACAVAAGYVVPVRWARIVLFCLVCVALLYTLGSIWSVLNSGSPAWSELSFFIAASVLVSAVMSERGWMWRGVYVVSLVLFYFFYNSVAAPLLLVFLLAYAGVLFFIKKGSSAPLPLAGAVLLAIVIFFTIPSPLPLAPDIRPSFTTSELVLAPEYAQSIQTVLVGTGPRSFNSAFELHRPAAFNMTSLSDASFDQGVSTFFTMALELGVIGLLLYMVPFVLVAAGLVGEMVPEVLAVGAAALFCFAASVVYVVGLPLFLCGGLFTGYALTLLARHNTPRHVLNIVKIVCIVVAVAIAALVLFVFVHQRAAAYYHTRGIAEVADDTKVDAAAAHLQSAAAWWSMSPYLTDAPRIMLESTIAAFNDPAKGLTAKAAQTQIDKAVGLANQAVAEAPRDYSVWLARAALFVSMLDKQPHAVDEARMSIQKAIELSPTRTDSQALLSKLPQ